MLPDAVAIFLGAYQMNTDIVLGEIIGAAHRVVAGGGGDDRLEMRAAQRGIGETLRARLERSLT